MPAQDELHRIERRGAVIVATIRGNLDVAASRRLFGDVLREAQRGKGPQVLVYEVVGMNGFDMRVIAEAQQSAKDLEPLLRGFGVVTAQAAVRFGLSMVQLVTRRPIRAFERLDAALAWAADLAGKG